MVPPSPSTQARRASYINHAGTGNGARAGRTDRRQIASSAPGTRNSALGLWRGTAYGEFRHESWAEAEATRLDELRLVAAEDRADLLIALGRSGEAISSLGALIAANPYRDRPRGLLLQALSCEGRQVDALRAYQDYRSFLADEVGTDPSPSVHKIEQRVASSATDERQVVIERLRSIARWRDDGDPPARSRS